MLRNVSNEYQNNFWIECYKSIRKYFPDVPIKIIDNNSNYNYIKYDIELINCEIIKAEYPETRLYLPFYEFMKMSYKRAVIIHDGIIFNQFVDFTTFHYIKFLWHFETHLYDDHVLEMKQLNALTNNKELIDIYRRNAWFGCMGCLTVIDKECINIFEQKYTFSNLKTVIKNQKDAIAFERVLAVLAYAVHNELSNDVSYLGDIKNMVWGYTYNDYIKNPQLLADKPFIKLFGARK